MTRGMRRCGAAVLSALALGAALMVPPVQADQVRFGVTGSTQMYALGSLLGNRYSTVVDPNLRIDVSATTSQQGFDGACQDSTVVGMSDVYIQDSQLLEPGCNDMTGIPVAVSAVPAVYNLPGAYFNARKSDGFTLAHPVRLTAQVLASIYLCTVTRWNDPAIARLNPGVRLPSAKIRAFNSSEPGGSGFVFSQWLSRSDRRWQSAVGEAALQPGWPRCSIGTISSGAMVQAIKNTTNSLGFVGFDFAINNKLQAAALKNASGFFLPPSLNGVSVAIERALHRGFPTDFRASFVVADAPQAFNPADFEFIVLHKDLKTRVGAFVIHKAIKDFLTWTTSSTGGQLYIEQQEFRKIGKATKLEHGFVPVPKEIREAIERDVSNIGI